MLLWTLVTVVAMLTLLYSHLESSPTAAVSVRVLTNSWVPDKIQDPNEATICSRCASCLVLLGLLWNGPIPSTVGASNRFAGPHECLVENYVEKILCLGMDDIYLPLPLTVLSKLEHLWFLKEAPPQEDWSRVINRGRKCKMHPT